MKYSIKDKSKPSLPLIILGVICIILVLWIARPFITSILSFIARPIWSSEETLDDFKREEIEGRMSSRQALVKKNEVLEKTIDRLELQLVRLRALEVENERLKRIVGVHEEATLFVPAIVYVKPPVSPYDSYVVRVHKGEENAVEINEGNLVYAERDILIGRVVRSYASYAVVELFSQSGMKTNGKLENGTPVVLEGQGGGNFISRLPRDVEVTVGQIVRVQDERSQAVLGIIEEIEDVRAESVKTVYIRMPVNIYTTSLILIDADSYEENP